MRTAPPGRPRTPPPLGTTRTSPPRSGGPARPPGHRTAPGPRLAAGGTSAPPRRDQCPSSVGGAADGEGELGDAELRHQRCTSTGEGEAGVSAGGDPGGCFGDGLRWVLLGPGHRGESSGRRPHASLRPWPRVPPQHISRGVEVPRSVLVVAVMSEFKHRAPTETGEICLLWKGILDFLQTGRWSRWLLGVRCLVSSDPLASLAARPPVVAGPTVRFSGFETLASLAPQPPVEAALARSTTGSGVPYDAMVAATGAARRRAHAPAGRGRACGSSR